jgi:hypothetical protein
MATPIGLINSDVDIAEAACLPTKCHCSESRSHGGILAREFAATNRSRLKGIRCLDKQVMLLR